MKIWGMILGGFPRSRYARYALRDRERGVTPFAEDVEAIDRASAQIIGAQLAAGFPVVVDGMIDWHDIFRPFVDAWRNTTVDGLLRYFDNNFFYRIPVFTGEPDPREYVLPRRILRFKEIADPASLKAVLPGPVSFAYMSKNNSGLSNEELAEKIAYILRDEARKAIDSGASLIQIDEPFLADIDATRDHARLAAELVDKIVEGVEDKSIVSIYFNIPESSVFEELLNTRAKYIMIDVVDAPVRAESLVKNIGFGDHTPVLGAIDSRRIIDDKPSFVENFLKAIESSVDEVVVTTSTWLDLIPFRYALRKVYVLGRIVEELAGRNGYDLYSIWR
ncbi:MAG: hypothetical protein F7C08_03765 [Desulfurococcales archaeon]|nr:hypothetical protein [Desulfurococcales archaeon]